MVDLVYQYYIPFKDNPRKSEQYDGPWIGHGISQGRAYANRIGAQHVLCQKRFMRDPMPVELETVRVWQDPYFDKFDRILIADIDMIFNTDESIFDMLDPKADIAMVHEHNFRLHRSCEWTHNRLKTIMQFMYCDINPLPRSELCPEDPFRFLNGGIQVWSQKGRIKARKLFPTLEEYRSNYGTKEQMYLNTAFVNFADRFIVQELPEEWNSMNMNWDMMTWPQKKIIHCGGLEGKPRMMEILKCMS